MGYTKSYPYATFHIEIQGGYSARESMYIIFEGTDRVGKTTQKNALIKNLEFAGYSVAVAHFPDEKNEIGSMLRRWLRGELYLDKHAVEFLLAAEKYQRMEELHSMYQHMDFVIIDRFYRTGIAYAIARDFKFNMLMNMHKDMFKYFADKEITIYMHRSFEAPVMGDATTEKIDRDIPFQKKVAAGFTMLQAYFQSYYSDTNLTTHHIDVDVTKMTGLGIQYLPIDYVSSFITNKLHDVLERRGASK